MSVTRGRPLQELITSIERVRAGCDVSEQAPLDDLLADLRRWSRDLQDATADELAPRISRLGSNSCAEAGG